MTDTAKKNVHAAVAIIFDHTGKKIIAAKRQTHQSYAGYWELPGGKIELVEKKQPKLAIIRELDEELGINVTDCIHLGTVEHEYHDHNVMLEVFRVNKFSGVPHGREGQDITWVEIDKIDSLTPLLKASYKILDLI